MSNLDTPNKEDDELFQNNFYKWLEEHGVELDDQLDDGEWTANINLNKLKAAILARENHLKEDLKVVGGEDKKLPGEEDGSIIWESPKDAELRVQLIDALASTTFGFHSSQLEAIWPLIESRFKETTLSDAERFDYNRLKSLEIGSINRYEEFTNSEPDGPKRIAAFIHQLSPWNIDRGIEALESRDQRIALEAREQGVIDFCKDIKHKVDLLFIAHPPETIVLPWEQTVRPIIYKYAATQSQKEE